MKCDMYNCNRSVDVMTGWGNAFCHGHSIVGSANKATHGMNPITAEEYREAVKPALEWLNENPNPYRELDESYPD